MNSDGREISSCPSKRTEPDRLPMIPMMARSVDVLPAPFRPSRVTTSPLRTSKSTPCSTWLSPYFALRPDTASMGICPSGMFSPQVSLDHFRMVGDVLVGTLHENLSTTEHGDDIGEGAHHGE